MAEVGEAILKVFDVGFLLWRGCFHVLPGLPTSVVVQRSKPGVAAGVAGTHELPHRQRIRSIGCYMLQELAVIRHASANGIAAALLQSTTLQLAPRPFLENPVWQSLRSIATKVFTRRLDLPQRSPQSAWALLRSVHTALPGQVAGELVQPLVVISKPSTWVRTHSPECPEKRTL